MGKRLEHPTAKYINLRIATVSAILKTNKLYVVWKNGEEAVVDFSADIDHNTHFKPLSDPAKFQTVQTVAWNAGIEWNCGVGIGSNQLRSMADQQKSVIHKKSRKSA